MNLHEFQAKSLFQQFGVPVPKGVVAETPQAARTAYRQLESAVCAVKAQIHAGGRGKGGGVKLVRSEDEAEKAAAAILGKPLVTHQTGPEGRIVRRVLVEAGCAIDKEYYVGIVPDRKTKKPVLMASSEGGMEIEIIAAEKPDKIFKEAIDVSVGIRPFQTRALSAKLGLAEGPSKEFARLANALSRFFVEKDCGLVEINPLVLTKEGKLLALDGKVNIDDRAVYLHPDLEAMRDRTEEDSVETQAYAAGISYISLNGNIGCMVNGAGLAMATMDIIKLHGGMPANFLDVGGGASREQVSTAFKLLMSNKNVKAVLINIFGGILKCDVLAQGIVDALKEVTVNVPLVVRLEGTNVEKGRVILINSGLAIKTAETMTEAAVKVVEAAESI